MTTEKALKAYGYVKGENGAWRQPNNITHVWKRGENGGWLRFDPAHATIPAFGVADPAGGKAWGIALDSAPGWVQAPYRQRADEKWANVSGLHPALHPEAFEWEFPDDHVRELYEHAAEVVPTGNPYVRQSDGSLVRA